MTPREDSTALRDTLGDAQRRLQHISRCSVGVGAALCLALAVMVGVAMASDKVPRVFWVGVQVATTAVVVLSMVPIIAWIGRIVVTPVVRELERQTAAIDRLRTFVWHHGYGRAISDLVPDEAIPPPTPLRRSTANGSAHRRSIPH